MIKSVSIQNFESHEDTTIHFSDGMNLIVGLSNSGKSAIIRALACAVDNKWDKSMVRTGYDFCRVKIETDKGWVECERGEKANRWRCQENNGEIQSYKNVGATVPDLATKILGMGERSRGSDISELPNFQFQLEKHYMLSEIDGKKATSNMIARMMDNAIGLGGMEELIKAISTDLLKDRKWLSEKQNEINELKNNIEDDAIFNKKQQLVDKIQKINNEVQQNKDALSKSESLNTQLKNCQQNIQAVQGVLSALTECDNAISLLQSIQEGVVKRNLIEKCESNIRQLDNLASVAQVDSNSMTHLLVEAQQMSDRGKLYDNACKVQNLLLQLGKVQQIGVDAILLLQNEVDSNLKSLSKAQNMLDEARKVWKENNDCQKEHKMICQQIDELENQLHQLKDKIGICPICGNSLTEK